MNSDIGPIGNFLVTFAKRYGDNEVRATRQPQRRTDEAVPSRSPRLIANAPLELRAPLAREHARRSRSCCRVTRSKSQRPRCVGGYLDDERSGDAVLTSVARASSRVALPANLTREQRPNGSGSGPTICRLCGRHSGRQNHPFPHREPGLSVKKARWPGQAVFLTLAVAEQTVGFRPQGGGGGPMADHRGRATGGGAGLGGPRQLALGRMPNTWRSVKGKDNGTWDPGRGWV